MECWYGLSGLGAVCHTLNPRLSDADLIYIINDAEDTILMSDVTFVPILERILPSCPSIMSVVLLDARSAPRPATLRTARTTPLHHGTTHPALCAAHSFTLGIHHKPHTTTSIGVAAPPPSLQPRPPGSSHPP
jgi:acyl-CoA synthetase (AMP-forming)/AMP-acid ligase II